MVLFSYLEGDVAIHSDIPLHTGAGCYSWLTRLTRYRWHICWWCTCFVAKRFFQGSTVADSTCAEAFWMLTSDFSGPVCELFFWNGFCLDFYDFTVVQGLFICLGGRLWVYGVHISEITWSCRCLKRKGFTGVQVDRWIGRPGLM